MDFVLQVLINNEIRDGEIWLSNEYRNLLGKKVVAFPYPAEPEILIPLFNRYVGSHDMLTVSKILLPDSKYETTAYINENTARILQRDLDGDTIYISPIKE